MILVTNLLKVPLWECRSRGILLQQGWTQTSSFMGILILPRQTYFSGQWTGQRQQSLCMQPLKTFSPQCMELPSGHCSTARMHDLHIVNMSYSHALVSLASFLVN